MSQQVTIIDSTVQSKMSKGEGGKQPRPYLFQQVQGVLATPNGPKVFAAKFFHFPDASGVFNDFKLEPNTRYSIQHESYVTRENDLGSKIVAFTPIAKSQA